MKILKKIMLCLMLIILPFICSACSTTRLMTVYNDDGTVDELIYVTLDSDEILSIGEDVNEIKTYAEDIARTTAGKIAIEFNSNHMLDFPNTAAPIQIIDVVWYEPDSFMVGLRFSSSAVYKSYYGISATNTAQMQTEKHWLYTKYYQTGCTTYALNSSLYSKISEEIFNTYPSLVKAKNKLLYTYTTTSRREHSDADYINHISGKYYHTWEIDRSNLNQQITIYYILANRAHIILLCLGAGLVVCAILCLIAFKIKRKKSV